MTPPSAEPEKCPKGPRWSYMRMPDKGIDIPCNGGVQCPHKAQSSLHYHEHVAHSTPPAPAPKCICVWDVSEQCPIHGHHMFAAAAPAVAPTPQPNMPEVCFTWEERQVLHYLEQNTRGMKWPIKWDAEVVKRTCEKIMPSTYSIVAGGAVAETPQCEEVDIPLSEMEFFRWWNDNWPNLCPTQIALAAYRHGVKFATTAQPVERTEKEQAVITELCAKLDLSEHALMRQGLRIYQLLQAGTHELREINPDLKLAAPQPNDERAVFTDTYLNTVVQDIVAISMCGINQPLWETRNKVRLILDKLIAEARASLERK